MAECVFYDILAPLRNSPTLACLANVIDFRVIAGFKGFLNLISSLTFFEMPSRLVLVKDYLRQVKRAWNVPFKGLLVSKI